MVASALSVPQRHLAGIALRLLAMALLSLMFALTKLAAERGVHIVEALFWRQALAIPFILGWVFAFGQLSQLASQRPAAHVRRSLLGISGIALNMGAVIILPMAEANTIGQSAPIFAVLLAALLLGERVDRARWGAVLLGFAGVLVVVSPVFSGALPAAMLPGVALALIGAMMNAAITVAVRDLGRTEAPMTILFWFAAISMVPLTIAMPFVMQTHDLTEWALILSIFASGFSSQMALTTSLRLAPVSVVLPIDYSGLLWATLFGWLLFDTLPAASTWLGAPLIIAGGLMIVWREQRRRASPAAEIAA